MMSHAKTSQALTPPAFHHLQYEKLRGRAWLVFACDIIEVDIKHLCVLYYCQLETVENKIQAVISVIYPDLN